MFALITIRYIRDRASAIVLLSRLSRERKREREREQERKRQKCSGFQRDLLPVRAIYTRVSWTEIMQNSRGLTSGTFIGRPIIKYRERYAELTITYIVTTRTYSRYEPDVISRFRVNRIVISYCTMDIGQTKRSRLSCFN